MPLKNAGLELCAACLQPVKITEGVQCQGPCGRWRHYRCLDVSACKIHAVKTGELVLRCPCPDCEPNTQNSISWQAPCCKGRPCPTFKDSRSSTIATHIDASMETATSYKQLPDQSLNECRLSQCISPTTCPPCPSDPEDLYSSKVGSKGQKQNTFLDIPESKSGPGGSISKKFSEESDRRNGAYADDDRRRSPRDAEDLDRDTSTRTDERRRSLGELTETDSNTYRGERAFGGTDRDYGSRFEKDHAFEKGYNSERGYSSERGYAGGGSDKTGRIDTDLLRKSAVELKSSTKDLRMKQEVVTKCFESVRLLFEAVDNLSRKINEVVENVIVTLDDNNQRYVTRRPSADSRGRLCFCPQNLER